MIVENSAFPDMANLLKSREVATVFLEQRMSIRRFTSHATRLFKLMGRHVGRSLSDVVMDLDYPQLIDDAAAVLKTLAFMEKEAPTRWSLVPDSNHALPDPGQCNRRGCHDPYRHQRAKAFAGRIAATGTLQMTIKARNERCGPRNGIGPESRLRNETEIRK